MDNQQFQNRHYHLTIDDIESQIKNNQYKSKEELANQIVELRKNGIINVNDHRIEELLDLFDRLNTSMTSTSMDMKDYKTIGLKENDLIVAKEKDRILKTQNGTNNLPEEFKKNQNTLIANNNEKIVSADEVFERIASQEKEELELLTLEDAVINSGINTELLNKIKFFVQNSKMNPHSFKVNIETGLFYNNEENAVYEVRKNEADDTLEIYKGSEKTYEGTAILEDKDEELIVREEKQEQEEDRSNTKVRVRRPDYMNRAAFTNAGFLIMNIVTIALLTIMMLLLKK